MTRINTMVVCLAALVVAFVVSMGCVPAGVPGVSDAGVLTGTCTTRSESRPCSTACVPSGFQVCNYITNPDGTRSTDLMWGVCAGVDTCSGVDAGSTADGGTMLIDAEAPIDAGSTGTDAGMSDTDAGVPGSDAGMPSVDGGVPMSCDPALLYRCVDACIAGGGDGYRVCDPVLGLGPCLPFSGSCAPVVPTDCPCEVGTSTLRCTTVVTCSTACGYGVQSWQDYCLMRPCWELVRAPVCLMGDAGVPMTDAGVDAGTDSGVMPLPDAGVDAGDDAGMDAGFDAGMDAGTDAGTDAGSDAGVDAGFDAGTDAGPPPVDAGTDAGTSSMDAGVDAGTDAGPPPVDAGTDSGIADAGVSGSDAGRPGPLGVMYVELDPSVAWCPSGGTVQFRNWDNTSDGGYEHFDALTVPVPISSSGIVLSMDGALNNTIWCSRSGMTWDGYFSPVLVGAAIASHADAIGVRRVTMDGYDITSSVLITWDFSRADRDNTTALSFHRVQILPRTTSWVGCYDTSCS